MNMSKNKDQNIEFNNDELCGNINFHGIKTPEQLNQFESELANLMKWHKINRVDVSWNPWTFKQEER